MHRSKFFSELYTPNWSEYFVQIKYIKVDYLREAEALTLIEAPYPDFRLNYLKGVAKRIYEVTQGHPSLIQQICSEIVNFANRNSRRTIDHSILDIVLKTKILDRENPAILIFWTQFCTTTDKITINQILSKEVPSNRASLYRLEQHGYILKDKNEWKLRVPLFEMWLEKFSLTFELS